MAFVMDMEFMYFQEKQIKNMKDNIGIMKNMVKELYGHQSKIITILKVISRMGFRMGKENFETNLGSGK